LGCDRGEGIKNSVNLVHNTVVGEDSAATTFASLKKMPALFGNTVTIPPSKSAGSGTIKQLPQGRMYREDMVEGSKSSSLAGRTGEEADSGLRATAKPCGRRTAPK
jgi:hypothetical protein